MSDEKLLPDPRDVQAWQAHDRSQLEYFRALSLHEKLEAIQGMADVSRRLRDMRARGELMPGVGTGQLAALAGLVARPAPLDISEKWSGFGMRMTPIDSTAIARTGYSAAKRILRLEYRSGRVYDYFDVPQEVYKQLLRAESAGEFVNLEIKPGYDCSEVE